MVVVYRPDLTFSLTTTMENYSNLTEWLIHLYWRVEHRQHNNSYVSQ